MLVAFVWLSNEDLCLSIMFPEYMACDTIFGVTREQSNLFVVAGINRHNTFVIAIRCFVSSKETKAYLWAMITSLRHLVLDKILSLKQCIIFDQELTIY